MKIAKKAEQKNIILNTEFYIRQQIARMLESHEAFYFTADSGCAACYDFEEWRGENIRIFTDNLAEVKVILADGFYETVAVGKNGETYFVSL